MALEAHASSRSLGHVVIAPFDVVLGAQDVYQPDVIFVAREQDSIIGEHRIEGAPDLVVEILSASTAVRDQTVKRATYERSGVREYWIIDPSAESVEVLVNGASGFRQLGRYAGAGPIMSVVLPELGLAPATIFG